MAARKTERLMNLIFTLLVSRQYLTKSQIRQAIADYRNASNDAAFDRMFERDKDDLRELGINVEIGSHDPLFGDEMGYRISRADAELSDVELTREEAAVIGLATQVWEHVGLATESTTALVKLKAIGVDVDTSVLRMAEPQLSTDEPAFDDVWEAATRRMPISFVHQRSGGETMERHLQPWGILSWRDRWYVGGFDLDRQAPRLFRVSRIVGEVTATGPAGSYEVPEGTDMRQLARTMFGDEREQTATLRVRDGRGQSLRRLAARTDPAGDGFDVVDVTFGSQHQLAAEIASYGTDVVVVSPPELKALVIERLRAAMESTLRPVR